MYMQHTNVFNKVFSFGWVIKLPGWGSVPVDFLRPKFRVAHTKHDVISILMNKYTYTNMYIIKKIMSCIFILCWDITALLKLKWKFCRLRIVKIEKILTVTYRTLLPKTTNFLKNGGWKKCLYLKIISYSAKYKTYSGTVRFVFEKPARPPAK